MQWVATGDEEDSGGLTGFLLDMGVWFLVGQLVDSVDIYVGSHLSCQ